MPRYFFHARDSSEFIDRDGVELPGPGEARVQAVVAAGEALKDLDGEFWDGTDWRMWVTDESGATGCKLTFSAQ
jgi:hypothetical protein